MVSSALSESKLLCPNGYPNGNPNFSNQKLESRSRLPDTFTMWTSHVRVRCSLLGDSPANSPAFARRIRKSFAFECIWMYSKDEKQRPVCPFAAVAFREIGETSNYESCGRWIAMSNTSSRCWGNAEEMRLSGNSRQQVSERFVCALQSNQTLYTLEAPTREAVCYECRLYLNASTNGTAGGESGEELGKQQQQSHTGNLLLTILNSQLRTLSLSLSLTGWATCRFHTTAIRSDSPAQRYFSRYFCRDTSVEILL